MIVSRRQLVQGSLASLLSPPNVRSAFAAKHRPNIVLVVADDLGYSDLGCYGSEISTPNLDELAGKGLRFTQFYNAARCCPSRSSLMTGLYPHQAGVGHMSRDLGIDSYRGRLGTGCVTLAEALKLAGYRTLMSGKWHLGSQADQLPASRGFDRSFVSLEGGRDYFHPRDLLLEKTPFRPPADFYITDAFTQHALQMLDEAGGQRSEPFFLYLAYTAPHFPLHALPEDIERNRGRYLTGWDAVREQRYSRMTKMGIIRPEWKLSDRHPDASAWDSTGDKDEWDLKMAVYAAQIQRMDYGIGRVLGRLKSIGAESNTLVLFLSDNGACAEHKAGGKPNALPGSPEYFGAYGLPWANASNTPFRMFKHWAFEGGISTPLIARWPERMRSGGGITHQPGHVIDLMATFLDCAGAAYPRAHGAKQIVPLEGRSLLPILEGKKRKEHDGLFWEHEGNRAVRQGQWKLTAGFQEPWKLYNLTRDRTETEDLAEEHPALVARLEEMYDGWARRCGVVPWTEQQEREMGIPV